MMPQNIEHADFSEVLKKPSSNKIEAKRFLAKYPTDYIVDGIELPDNFQLKANKKQTSIRLLDRNDKDNPRIAYAVDIEITHEKINHKSCSQVLVWANPRNEELLTGFPRKIFNHLLQKHIVMITDKQQTADGKRFWERRIIQALGDNRFVYFCDKKEENMQWQRIGNDDDFFEKFEPIGWGNDKLHQNKLFVMSMTELEIS